MATKRKSTNDYGRYLRNMRLDADISLRSAAKNIGVSAVYFSEVERGVRPPMKKDRWDALLKAIPTLDAEQHARLAANAKPIQLDLRDAPPKYQDLGLALARRIEKKNLSDTDFERLYSILGDKHD